MTTPRKPPSKGKSIRARPSDPFTQGYILACANILRTHDEPVVAHDVLINGVGTSRTKLEEAGVAEEDLDILKDLLED